MKKTIVMMIMAAAMLFVGFGCAQPAQEQPQESAAIAQQEESAQQSQETPSQKPQETSSQQPGQEESESADGDTAEDGTVAEGTTVFGKVKNIVGNEIELELANPPFEMEAPDGEGKMIEHGSTGVEEKSFTYRAEEDAGAAGAEGGSGEESVSVIMDDGSGNPVVIGGGSDQKMELEYTGESKSVIIPAGTEILNLLGGEGTLDSIKKGSVLMVGVEDEGAETLKATDVIVME